MRLTEAQKAAVLRARPGSRLVRLTGGAWCAVWREPHQDAAERWRGSVVSRVEGTAARPGAVWFVGGEYTGRTRHECIANMEADNEQATNQ